MVAALLAASSPAASTGLRQLGLGLALGVLLDATIVRSVLVPALMAVLGRWNWWLPARRTRLRVEPSPLRQGGVREGAAPLPQPGTTLTWRR